MTQLRLTALASVVALGISGCVSKPTETTANIQRDLAELRQMQADLIREREQIPSGTPRIEVLQEVTVPEGAPWLAYPTTIALVNADARTAIAAVLEGKPVSFQLTRAPEFNPLVSDSLSATTVQGQLDAIMAQANWSYEVDSGVVIVTDTVVGNFRLLVPPGRRVYNLATNSLGSAAGSQQGSTNLLNGSQDPYIALSLAMQSLGFIVRDQNQQMAQQLGQQIDGPSYALIESVGMLVASGAPNKVAEAKQLVEWFNSGHNTKAIVEITVYEIDLSNGFDRSLDVALLREAATQVGLDIARTATTASVGNAGLSFAIDDADDRLNGSTAVLSWLNQQGDTSTRLNRRVELTNNELATVESRQNNPYVEEVSRDSFNTGAITSTAPDVQIGNRDTGFALNILPTINPDKGEVSLRINLSRADFIQFFSYSFDEGNIAGQVPIVSEQNDVITVNLYDGEVKIITSAALSERSSSRTSTPLLPRVGDSTADSEKTNDFVMVVSVVLV